MCIVRSEDNILFQTESLSGWNFSVQVSLAGPPASRDLPNAVCHLTIARITGKHTWLFTRVLYPKSGSDAYKATPFFPN